MKQKRIVFLTACVVLIFQLISLDPFLSLPVSIQGTFTSALDKIAVVPQNTIKKSQLASESDAPSDVIVFVGDVMLGRNVENLMHRRGSDYPFLGLDLIKNYPQAQVVGNFEASMSESHVETPAYDMRFSVDDAFLPALKEAHFTHLSLANNHSFDHGQGGYKNAISMLEMNSLTAFGNGETIDNNSITYLSTNRGTIALIGINATQRIPSDEEIAKVFLSASRHSSFQVAFIHWGNEYEPKHSSTQRILAEILVSAGADLIVGHHPHVVQDVDIVKGVVVFYSLGNYIFDQYFSKEVQNGLVIALDLQNNPTLILTPTTAVNNLSQPTPMAVADQQKFLHDLSLRSHPSLMEKIKAGSVPLLDTVATSTKVAMM